MAKFFNTAGLCNPDDHYMVDPLDRLTEIVSLLESKLYFTIHAPRRTGKTTLIHALARRLNKEGRYIALTVSFESAGYQSITVEKANAIFHLSNGQPWLDRYIYKESAHHLLLMAFLQRVINGGGRIVREMALGNQRIDLCVVFGKEEFALELKINRHSYTL